MQLLDELRDEHQRIERTLGALRTFTARLRAGGAGRSDLPRFVTFFEVYAGRFHHEREEQLLVPALTGPAGLPLDRGPIAVILDDHARMSRLLSRMAGSADPIEIDFLATLYSHELWQHIDIENSVLFPESEQQLRRAGISELPCRPLTDDEREARQLCDELCALYPPLPPDSIRGEGCVMCHAYGDACRGLEREWWNEWMWEELDEHVAAS